MTKRSSVYTVCRVDIYSEGVVYDSSSQLEISYNGVPLDLIALQTSPEQRMCGCLLPTPCYMWKALYQLVIRMPCRMSWYFTGQSSLKVTFVVGTSGKPAAHRTTLAPRAENPTTRAPRAGRRINPWRLQLPEVAVTTLPTCKSLVLVISLSLKAAHDGTNLVAAIRMSPQKGDANARLVNALQLFSV